MYATGGSAPGTNRISTGAAPSAPFEMSCLHHLAGARLEHGDGVAGILEVRRPHGARDQQAVDAVMHGDAVRIRLRRVDRLLDLVGLGIADDDLVRAHAGQVPGPVVLGEHDILADLALGHRDRLHPVRIPGHVDDPNLTFDGILARCAW